MPVENRYPVFSFQFRCIYLNTVARRVRVNQGQLVHPCWRVGHSERLGPLGVGRNTVTRAAFRIGIQATHTFQSMRLTAILHSTRIRESTSQSQITIPRSEERRVGKDSRTGRSRDQRETRRNMHITMKYQ